MLLLALLAALALALAAIGVYGLNYYYVTERTQEIGMRMAVGARKRDIRRQFLLEAALLSVAGGLVGVALGGLAAFGVRGALDFPASVTPGIVLTGLALSAVVGLAAGYWPARSASNLLVVDALRSE